MKMLHCYTEVKVFPDFMHLPFHFATSSGNGRGYFVAGVHRHHLQHRIELDGQALHFYEVLHNMM